MIPFVLRGPVRVDEVLGMNCFNGIVKIKRFRTIFSNKMDELRVDIREWVDGGWSSSGVNIPLKRFLMLQDSVEGVDKLLRKQLGSDENVKYSEHLGGNTYISVTHPFVGVKLQQWYYPTDGSELKAGAAIFLKYGEWRKFKNVSETLSLSVPELAQTERCMDQMDHCNQLGAQYCMECNPNWSFTDQMDS